MAGTTPVKLLLRTQAQMRNYIKETGIEDVTRNKLVMVRSSN
jgi:hypothetical protein